MILKTRFAPVFLILAIAGCGGGGGGGGETTPPPAAGYDGPIGPCGTIACSNELAAQYGIVAINADELNDDGYSGKDIRVAVVDSGIAGNHSEFNGRIAGGRDFINSGGYLTDTIGHGSHVAGIIAANRDDIGMRGIAYNADLYIYKTIGGGLGDIALSNIATQHITDNILISNNSWSFGNNMTDPAMNSLIAGFPLAIAGYKNAVAQGTIFVWAAGNAAANNPEDMAGLPYFIADIEDQWLAVAAVDSNLQETNYTNRCGLAADWCVTAPGSFIYSVDNDGGYVTESGTSMAAPHVSGLLALMAEKFTVLTAAELVERLKVTSSLYGLTDFFGNTCTIGSCNEVAMRLIFGHGMVNKDAALSQIGSINYALGGNVFTGESIDIASNKLHAPAGLGDFAATTLAADSFVGFDSFDGANFTISGSEVFETDTSAAGVGALGYAGAWDTVGTDRANNQTVAFNGFDTTARTGFYMSDSNTPLNLASASFWGARSSLLASPEFITPSYSTQMESSNLLSGNFEVRPFFQMSNDADMNGLSGYGVNLIYRPNPRTGLLASISQSTSYFDFDATEDGNKSVADVQSLELGITRSLTSNLEVFGRLAMSRTDGFAATSTTWGLKDAQFRRSTLGVEYRPTARFRMAFGAYDPGHFTSGQISLYSANGRAPDGTLGYGLREYDIDAETSPAAFLAASYALSLGGRQAGAITFSLQQSPYDHSEVANASLQVALRF